VLGAPVAAQALISTRIATGFNRPLYLTSPPGDTERMFVIEQFTGLVKIIKNGVVLPTPFIDLNPIVINGGNERGLLGLAFHPDYATNRKFYVSYNDNAGASVVREYLRDSANPDLADPASFTTIFGPLAQPFTNHTGGCIQFGPDGMLYFGLGDGGSANDPGNRAQTLSNELGKMHRFDVDNPPSYVPADNPYIGAPNDPSNTIPDTIWAYGLRNPWRFSFDRATGDMLIGDVGQNAIEEIDFQPASSTGTENYGWRCMEGNNCTGLTGCTCNAASLSDPIHTYGHGGGNCSVTGGYVYRGPGLGSLTGHYFFADYCSARIWTFRYDGTTLSNLVERTVDLAPDVGAINLITSFGEDALGQLYILDQDGEIFRVDQDCTTPTQYCTSTPNSSFFPAFMSWQGTTSIAANDFVLEALSLPNGAIGIFFGGTGTTQVPFGNGFLCVTGGVRRLGVTVAMGGVASRPFNVNGPHGPAPGDTCYFQHWYRDPAGGGAEFNLTDGLGVRFCP
jgi:glucose/arabinose dehydrogenase